MTDQVEQTAQADSATATEQVEQVAHEQTAEGLLSSPEPTEGLPTEQQPEDDLEEVEYEGRKLKLPAEAKAALMRYADYTRKTQEVAEHRREIEAQRAQVQQVAQLHQQMTAEMAEMHFIDRRTQQLQQVLSQVNWQALTPEQQPQAMQLQAEFSQLQARRGQLGNAIAQKINQKQLTERQETATLYSKAEEWLKREFKSWETDRMKVADYAKSVGIDTERLQAFMLRDPAIAKVIDQAAKYEQLLKKQTAKAPAPPAQPISKVTQQASPAITNPDKLPNDQWLEWREKQLAAKRTKR